MPLGSVAALGAPLPRRGALRVLAARRAAVCLLERPRRSALADGALGIVRRHVTAASSASDTPRTATLVREPSARARCRPALAAGHARPRGHLDDADLHPRHASGSAASTTGSTRAPDQLTRGAGRARGGCRSGQKPVRCAWCPETIRGSRPGGCFEGSPRHLQPRRARRGARLVGRRSPARSQRDPNTCRPRS